MKNKSLVFILLIATFLVFSCKKEETNTVEACFVTPMIIEAGIPAVFNSSCSVNGVSFSWNFGDGSSSQEANPTHTFSEGGDFSVTLTVTDADGSTDEVTHSVSVEAPSLIEHSGAISSDETWIEGMHLITSDVHVNGAILTIEPGATVMFASGTALYIGYQSGASGATLLANGTAEKPITFTSSAATKSAGDWDFIWFDENASMISSMQYCMVEYGGGYSDGYGAIHVNGSSLAFDHSSLHYAEHFGISLTDDGMFSSFTENTMSDVGLHLISIYGENTHTIGSGNNLSGAKGIRVRAGDIEASDVTWLKQTCAYEIEGNLYVGSASSAKLTLMPGVEIRMGAGAALYVGYRSNTFGTLIAEGNSGERILITSSAAVATKSPGDWDFLWFDDGAGTNSSLAYCDLEYGGGYSENYGMIHVNGSSISISNSSIGNSEYKGVTLTNDGFFESCEDNVFEDNGTYPIEIFGNWTHTIGAGNGFISGSGILVRADDMEQSNVSWLNHDVPYIFTGSHYIGSTGGSTLNIEPGTVLKFTESSRMYVGYHSGRFGNLVASGEVDNEIVFTSGAATGFETPGDWDGIWFYDGTGAASILDHCILSYGGGYGSNSGNLNIQNESAGIPVISNCQIENSAAWGVYLGNNADPTLTDNTFSNNASGDISE
jgi:parallel beta-helix repeat protein